MNSAPNLDFEEGVVPRMGFEPTNSYKNGFLIRVWRLMIDLESVAVGHLATSAQSAERFHLNIAVLAESKDKLIRYILACFKMWSDLFIKI